MTADTKDSSYTERLRYKSSKRWKKITLVQAPYRWNLLRLHPGKTLDIGCGIGRYLRYLPEGSVGIDHNKHSVKIAKNMGLDAYTLNDFKKSSKFVPKTFDSILLSHVLEHLTNTECIDLIRIYSPLLKKTGKIVIMCPQRKGYASDSTHVTFQTPSTISTIVDTMGYKLVKSKSFPFPSFAGKWFTHNEYIVVATKK